MHEVLDRPREILELELELELPLQLQFQLELELEVELLVIDMWGRWQISEKKKYVLVLWWKHRPITHV